MATVNKSQIHLGETVLLQSARQLLPSLDRIQSFAPLLSLHMPTPV